MRKSVCERDEPIDANGERLANGDSLVPPTARILSFNANNSNSDMPSDVSVNP